MKKPKLSSIYYLFFVYCFLLSHPLSSQSRTIKSEQVFNQILIEDGFQSLEIQSSNNNKLIVKYENRRYRFEATAIKRILDLLQESNMRTIDTLVLVPKRWNIPLLSIELLVVDYQNFKNKTINSTEFGNRLIVKNHSKYTKSNTRLSQENTGNFKIEIEVEPQLKLALGGNPDPVIHQINLILRANIYLWKGAKFTFGAILPISNEFQIEEEKMIRPELMAFSQYVRLPSNIYAGLSIGYFTKYRYGSAIEVGKFFLNGNLLFKGKIGYTGYASYPKRLLIDRPEKGWQVSNLNYLDYSLGASYRYAKWDVRLGVEYGKVQFYKDFLQVNLTRQIKETEIGFFAFKTNNGENYGVQLAIPLYPKKYWKPRTISIRPSKQFKYTYLGDRAYITQYQTGSSLEALYQHLNPSFIKNQLLTP